MIDSLDMLESGLAFKSLWNKFASWLHDEKKKKTWFLRLDQLRTTALHHWLRLSVTSCFHCSTVITSAGQRLHISFSQLKSHVVLTWPVCAGQQANVHTATRQCRTWCTVSPGFKLGLASHVDRQSFASSQSIIWRVNKLYFYSVLTWWLWPWMESCLFEIQRLSALKVKWVWVCFFSRNVSRQFWLTF